jgi:hypothetical protein
MPAKKERTTMNDKPVPIAINGSHTLYGYATPSRAAFCSAKIAVPSPNRAIN